LPSSATDTGGSAIHAHDVLATLAFVEHGSVLPVHHVSPPIG
jgi:hypothetical protein